MILRAREHSSPEWPFWLLLAAWICANTPQVALFTALTWLTEGRSFAHQQRLTLDVACLLAGEKPSSPITDTVAAAQKQIPAKSIPPIPADAVIKKIELSLETISELLPAALRASHRIGLAWLCPPPQRCAPPHGPPRVSIT